MTTPATGADPQAARSGGFEADRRPPGPEGSEATLSLASAVASTSLPHRPRAADDRNIMADEDAVSLMRDLPVALTEYVQEF